MNKIKYIGGWSVNNGSTCGDGYEYTSLREACKHLREIAAGNVSAGGTVRWRVCTADGREVKSGVVRG